MDDELTRPIDAEPTRVLRTDADAQGLPAPSHAGPTYTQPTTYDAPAPYAPEQREAPYAPPQPQAPAPYGAPAPYPQAMAPAPSVQPAYGQYSYTPYALGEHPQTQLIFIMGIIGIFTGVTSFVAWYMGGQARKEIAAGAPYRWDGSLKTGYVLGKVFGIITIVGYSLLILFWILYIAFFAWLMTQF